MMNRVLEPELMDDQEQALAYAKADFEEENQGFVDRFLEFYPEFTSGHVLDLGCGPADIPIRLARALPDCRMTGVDGSAPMIALGAEAIRAAGLANRITLRCERFQETVLEERADAVISNSLLHHVPNALQFWYAVKKLAQPGAVVMVMDLLRPESPEAAKAIVEKYAADEPAILRRDFYNSLLASYTEDEVASQLTEMNLSRLLIDVLDDRHWIVGGRLV
ncbi:MAG TPA: class I SAM-dependent methyltransferase [Nitrospirales bacterium]|nr:class I SAM-dependent methyltransferase [Nitrospirales bacterium]